MKAAIYARVNTSNNGQDPTRQTRELREYCERHWWAVAGEYVDIGISGTKEKRPELDRLMGDAHRRRFDAVVVWKFDRFARSVSHLLRALETFKAQGIEFVSFSEQLDTPHPRGNCVHCVGGRGGVGALSHRRARADRTAQRERQKGSHSDVRASRSTLRESHPSACKVTRGLRSVSNLNWARGRSEGLLRRPLKSPSKPPLQLLSI
jgi:Resolvase, N terminal domain